MAHATPVLEAQHRDKMGSRYALRLREAGRLPAVVYGHKLDPVHISLDAKAFDELLHHSAHLIELKVEGKSESCLIKDVQYDYLDTTPVHVDLARVDLNEEVELDMEVEFVGRPVGLNTAGAMLDHPLTVITIRCKASSIPDKLTHDVSSLNVEDAVYVSDLKLPEGVSTVTEGDTMMAHVIVQAAVAEDEDSDTSTTTQPEVIGAKKDDEVDD